MMRGTNMAIAMHEDRERAKESKARKYDKLKDTCDELGRRLKNIVTIIEDVEHRAQFGAVVTPTLEEMTQEEMTEIYRLAKGMAEGE